MSDRRRDLRIINLSWLGWIKAPVTIASSAFVLLNLVTSSDTVLSTFGNQIYALLWFVKAWPNSVLDPGLVDPAQWLDAVEQPALAFLLFAAAILVVRRSCELRPMYNAIVTVAILTLVWTSFSEFRAEAEDDEQLALFISLSWWAAPFLVFFFAAIAALASRWQRIIVTQPWSVLWTIYGTALARFGYLAIGLLALVATMCLFVAKLSVIFAGEFVVEQLLRLPFGTNDKLIEANHSFFWTGVVLVAMGYEAFTRKRFRGVALFIAIWAVYVLAVTYWVTFIEFGDDPRPLSAIRDATPEGFRTFVMSATNAFEWIAPVLLLRNWVVGRSLRPIEVWLRRMRLDAQEIMAATSKQPILFLRSFKDDDRWTWASFRIANWIIGRLEARVRIEEIVAQAAIPHGPLVALSNPRDKLEPLGAARAQVSDESWQDYVKRRIDDCRMIVCFLGDTENFRWEIEEILRLGAANKLILVMPPSYLEDRSIIQSLPELAARLGVSSLAGEQALLRNAKVLAWSARENGFAAIKSSSNSEFAYLDCIRLGIGLNLAPAAK